MPVRFKMCRVRADSSGTLCRQKARTAKRPEDGMIRCFKAHPIIHFPKGLAGEGGQMLLPVEAAVPVPDSRIHISTRQFSWSRPSLACFEFGAQKKPEREFACSEPIAFMAFQPSAKFLLEKECGFLPLVMQGLLHNRFSNVNYRRKRYRAFWASRSKIGAFDLLAGSKSEMRNLHLPGSLRASRDQGPCPR